MSPTSHATSQEQLTCPGYSGPEAGTALCALTEFSQCGCGAEFISQPHRCPDTLTRHRPALTGTQAVLEPMVPGLQLDLLLQLCDLGLQRRDGGLELGLDCPLHLLELAAELLVLPLQLLPRALVLLGCAALRGQLVAELLGLGRRVKAMKWRAGEPGGALR